MASLEAGLGGAARYATLTLLPPAEVAEARRVVLLVLDGLGYNYLQGRRHGALLAHCRGRMTSMFPTTTAAAVTTFMTGLAPQQHALTGWFVRFEELAEVAAVLPFRARAGGSLSARTSAARLYGLQPLAQRLPVAMSVVLPAAISDSEYSNTLGQGARRVGYQGLEGLVDAVTAEAGGGARYVYAYWPGFDSIAHEHGVQGVASARHFRVLDAVCADLLERLRGTGTLLLVTADHGFVDSTREHTVRLEEHPGLADMLRAPLCGEPRVAYCYVKRSHHAQFAGYVRDHLAQACTLYSSAQAVAEGWFGPGEPHPRLHERVGDFLLLMNPGYIIKDVLPGERPFYPVGNHGGLTEDELYVPLIVAPPS